MKHISLSARSSFYQGCTEDLERESFLIAFACLIYQTATHFKYAELKPASCRGLSSLSVTSLSHTHTHTHTHTLDYRRRSAQHHHTHTLQGKLHSHMTTRTNYKRNTHTLTRREKNHTHTCTTRDITHTLTQRHFLSSSTTDQLLLLLADAKA